MIYGALVIFPAIFVGVNKALGSHVGIIDAMCVYGYSFTVYVVASVLCILPISTWR